MAATRTRGYWTIGSIAKHAGEPIHRIAYAIKTRQIRSSGMAGNAHVYNDEQVEEIAAALREMDGNREGR
jgi:hypothetical protein